MTMAGRSSDGAGGDELARAPGRSRTGACVRAVRQVEAEDADEVLEVVRPAVRDGRRAHGVLEHQVPADDPGEQLAQRGVGVGVGRAGHRDHRGELRVAQRGEDAGDAGDHEGEDQRRAGLVVRGHAGEHEDAGADDRADAQAGELDRPEDAAQPVLALHLLEQHGERLRGEELLSHRLSSWSGRGWQ